MYIRYLFKPLLLALAVALTSCDGLWMSVGPDGPTFGGSIDFSDGPSWGPGAGWYDPGPIGPPPPPPPHGRPGSIGASAGFGYPRFL